MCLQLVCHICGKDLGDDKSLVLCFEYELSRLLRPGDHTDCPDYVRKKADVPNRCNFCLEVDPSVAGVVLAPSSRTSDYIE